MRERTVTWRRQHRRPRVGFMPVTILAAVLVVALVSWLARGLVDPRAHADALEQYAESLVERDLADRGWVAVAVPAARAPGPALAPAPPRPGRSGPIPYPGDAAAALARAADELRRVQDVTLLLPERSFVLELFHGPVTGHPPPVAAAAAAAAVVAAELGRYPPRALRGARFRRVLLCAELAEGGARIPSLPNYQQTLLLDVASPPDFLPRLLHHELLHFIDFSDDDQVLVDPAWEALNERYFVYGVGGRAMREPGSSRLARDLPGFVSRYATAALEEDKAEVFSFLMTAPGDVAALAAADPVLRRKIAAIERQVGAALPALDARFFRAVARGER